MGGTLILLAILVSTLLWADLRSLYVWIVLGVTVAYGLLGFADDYRKLILRNPKGLSAREKLFWQSLVAIGVGVILYLRADSPQSTALLIPYFKDVLIPLGWLFIPFVYVVIVGTSNAVNLTDGLDGLAIMPTVLVGGALGHLRLGRRQRHLRPLPRRALRGGSGRAAGVLRGARRRRPGLPVVQRLPGAGLHGRHRRAVPRRGAGRRWP